MNQFDLLQNISKYLARFSEQVQITNAAGTFHLNIHAENLLVGLLNATYDLDLVNVNHVKNGNYPGIDLLDEKNGVAFQVTSMPDMEKIKKTIAGYFANRTYEKAPILKMYMLTRKISNSQAVIDKLIVAEKKKLLTAGVIKHIDDVKIDFSVKRDILDKDSLFADLNASNHLLKIKKVEKLLEQQFELIREANDLSGYHDELQSMYYEVVMNDEKGMTLDQVYVEPGFLLHNSAFGKEKESYPNKYSGVDHRYKIHEFLDDYLNGKNHLDCIEECRMFIILGYPGQGKSSFLKRFVHDYIKGGQNKTHPVYYFQLKNIRSVKAFISNPEEVLREDASSSLEAEIDKFKFRKSFLILDGLDELYMRDHLEKDDVEKLCKELVRLTGNYKHLRIMLTSRYGYIDDNSFYREKGIIIQLAEFTLSDQHRWLDKYRHLHPDTWLSKQKLNEFNEVIAYTYIKELIKQPMLLHMVATIHREVEESANRAKVYDLLFTELISRKYSRDGQIEILKKVAQSDLRCFLRELAFSIYQKGGEYITRNALLKLKSSKAFLSLLPGKDFINSIRGVMVSFYFRETKRNKEIDNDNEDENDYAIEFLHKSLKEYLVAEKIVYTLMTAFLEKGSRSGRYIIEDGNQALKLIWEIFSKNALSREIIQYINEIIENDKILPRELLCDRILMYLEYYLNKNFLYEFNAEDDDEPFKKATCCFSGMWSFVSSLGLKKNYLDDVYISSGLLQMIKYSSNTRWGNNISDFSYQDFSSLEMEDIVFFNSIFWGSILSGSVFDKFLFENCTFNNCSFEGLDLSNSEIRNSKLRQCNFKDSELGNFIISRTEFHDCNFEGASMKYFIVDDMEKEAKFFYNCNFNGVKDYEDTMEDIKFFCDEHCTFENLVVAKYELYSDEEDAVIGNNKDGLTATINQELSGDYKKLLD
jgi:NACHT domain/Pentapeptide repeats (9 copies)